MSPETAARLKRTALLCAVALLVGAGAGLLQIRSEMSASVKPSTASSVAGASIGGAFTLVNQDGETVTDENYAGSYKLIFFGFTFCPTICPTELQKISQALNQLETENSELAARVQPIFITVDPERDTPEVLQEYVSLFHPRLIGLTGTQDQIDAVKKVYKIYSAKVETEGSSDYTVDHSSFIYLMGPENEVLDLFRSEDSAQEISSRLSKILSKP